MPEEPKDILELEGRKDRVSFEPSAAELILKSSNGLSSQVLSRFKKVIAAIDQVKQTNRPHLTIAEIEKVS